MDKPEIECVEFDYTSFLGASCNKKWSFFEAMGTFAPVFSVVWRDSVKELSKPEDRLWDAALKSLSTRRSDESNLVALCRLAKFEGINEIKIVMPYGLDSVQLEKISTKGKVEILKTSQEEFLFRL